MLVWYNIVFRRIRSGGSGSVVCFCVRENYVFLRAVLQDRAPFLQRNIQWFKGVYTPLQWLPYNALSSTSFQNMILIIVIIIIIIIIIY